MCNSQPTDSTASIMLGQSFTVPYKSAFASGNFRSGVKYRSPLFHASNAAFFSTPPLIAPISPMVRFWHVCALCLATAAGELDRCPAILRSSLMSLDWQHE